MKKRNNIVVVLVYSLSLSCQAGTVVRELPDTKPGQVFGGTLGFMVGAIAGPLGALAGGGLSWLAGGKLQETSGISGLAYEIQNEDGSLAVIRSPNQRWQSGDRVSIVNGRLIAEQ